jgi:GNAT superfamily N-acetyltransferase
MGEYSLKKNRQSGQFVVEVDAPVEEINLIREKLNAYNRERTNGEYDKPGIEINLVLKDLENNIIGGVIVSTMLHVMHLEVLWVSEDYRKQGFGRELVLAAERIGSEMGCISSHTWTFEFQGPEFYPKLGYKLIGVYEGYPNDLKEYVFEKHLENHQAPLESNEQSIKSLSNGFYITDQVTKEDIETLHAGLRSYVDQYVGDEKNGISIKIVIRDGLNHVVGGLHAWTTIYNLLIEFVWIDEQYRNIGLGTRLFLEAESIAKKNGCVASLACPLSFHTPEFFHEIGYQTFGYSDTYPASVRENYMIKKYTANE